MVTSASQVPAWWNEPDEDELARGVSQAARTIRMRTGNTTHIARARENRARFENDPWPLSRAPSDASRQTIERGVALAVPAPLTFNVTRSTAETATATVGARNRVKVTMLTSGGTFSQRYRTIQANRLLDAISRDGGVHDVALQAFRDACVEEIGAVKAYARDGRVCFERLEPLTLIVDSVDGRNRAPRSMYITNIADRYVLASQFGISKRSKKGEALDREHTAEWMSGDDTVLQDEPVDDCMVRVFEAWRLPTSRGAKDGRHIVCTNSVVLLDEPWLSERFPISVFRWSNRQSGFWGYSLAEEVAPVQRRMTHTLERWAKALDRVAVPRAYFPKGSGPAKLSATIGEVVEVAGLERPVFDTPTALGPEWIQHFQMLHTEAFEGPGISRMQATAMKPAGLDSGEALREYNDQTTDRAATVQRAWETFNVDIMQSAIDVLANDEECGKREYIASESRTRTHRVSWEDVKHDQDDYVLTAHPTSMLARDFASRKQQVGEMVKAGLIDPEQGRRLLELPDLDAEADTDASPRDLVDKTIEHMLRTSEYVAPDPYMDLEYAASRARRVVARERVDGTSEDDSGIACVMEFGAKAQSLIDEAAKAMAPPPAPAPPTDPAMGPPVLPAPDAPAVGAPPMGAGGMIQ